MALTTCPDCSRQISDSAPTCPGCGRRMRRMSLTTRIGLAILAMGIAMLIALVVVYPAPLAYAVLPLPMTLCIVGGTVTAIVGKVRGLRPAR